MDKKEYTLKEAAKLINKSERTVRRYIDKLSDNDKSTMTNVIDKKIFVTIEFIKKYVPNYDNIDKSSDKVVTSVKEAGQVPTPKDNSSKELLEVYKAENELLKEINSELRESVKDKDSIIKDKDQIIKDKDKDFKTLTNAVLHLQNEIKALTTKPTGEPKEEKPEKPQEPPSKDPAPTNNKREALLFFIFMLLCAIVILIIIGFLN